MKIWQGAALCAGAGLFVVVAVVTGSDRGSVIAPAPTSSVSEPTTISEPTPVPHGPEKATVTRIIDGDTVELANGRKVRLLGIDSCEMDTDLGPLAKEQARLLLLNTVVTLRQEPGVTTGYFGRDLRYITLPDGRDFGKTMVTEDHTGVYEGANDAAESYLNELRQLDGALDRFPELCNDREPTTTTDTPVPDVPDYPNCAAARAAGVAPLHVGEPGYSTDLDGDGDGKACE